MSERNTRWFIMGTLAALVGIPIIVLALVGLPHVVREPLIESVVVGNTGRSRIEPSGRQFGETTQLLTGTPLKPGSRIEILTNGNETFPRLWRDLHEAQRSITVQMYYAKPGLVVDTTFALLAAASRRGTASLRVRTPNSVVPDSGAARPGVSPGLRAAISRG